MWDAVKAIWDAMSPDMQSTVVTAIVTVFTATVGALFVVCQIGKQARQAIEANRHNERLKLKLQIYKEFVPVSRDAESATQDLSSFIRVFASALALISTFREYGQPWRVPEARSANFLDYQNEMNRRILELLMLTERWQIIDHRTEIFRKAIAVARYNIDAPLQEYFNTAVRLMPHEVAEHPQQGTLLPWQPPDEEKRQELEQLGENLQSALLDLSCYIYDMQIEMQNLLLGELFEQRVSPRKPDDPDIIVIRLDKHKELNSYFENETPWGREKNRTEAEHSDRYANKS